MHHLEDSTSAQTNTVRIISWEKAEKKNQNDILEVKKWNTKSNAAQLKTKL